MSRNITISLSLLFILNLFQFEAFARASDDTWLGWRGLDKQGVKQSSAIPVTWSSDKNVLWKTAIPGSGHSSPVVSENNVIVSTAYHAKKNKILNEVTKYLITGLAFILLFLFFIFVFRTVRQKNNFQVQQIFNLWVFGFILGFILYFALTGIFFHIEDNEDHITQTCRWCFSGMVVSLCLVLATFTISLTFFKRVVLLLISLSWSAFILFFRPAPDYYLLTGDGFLTERIIKAVIIPAFIAFIIFITLFMSALRKVRYFGMMEKWIIGKTHYSNISLFQFLKKLFFGADLFIKRKPVSESGNNLSCKFSVISVFILLAGTVGTFIIGFYGIGLNRIFRYPVPSESFTFPLLDLYFRDSNIFKDMVFIGIAVWAISFIGSVFRDTFPKSKWFTCGIIVLALLIFVKKNYLTMDSEYVRAVVCLDKNTGSIKWTREVFNGAQSNLHPENSPASPTPVINGNYIYTYFGSPGLLCTDMDGNIIWENTKLPFEDIHGIGASPVYSNGLIIILNDMPKAPYITAIDSKTGKPVWTKNRKPWGGFHGAYRTPTIVSVNGKDIIVTWGFYGMTAYNVTTGNELWNYPLKHSNEQQVASIILKNDTILVPDPDKFYAFSLRCIELVEMSKLLSKEVPEIWTTKMKQKGPLCSSPVLYKDMIFMISDNGFASCLDVIDGKVLWREKLNGVFLASCTFISGNVYFSNTSGLTTVAAAEKKFRKICENQLPDPVYASLAPTSNQLFIRTTKHIWCIKEK
ncbi:MAG: PQQ-binding-like beta-propeller repeat protein [Bacteroidia bacterium]|nr:PQQ-binding-like beta-propeller repeat protein [Bacteroidia bacterium]